MVNLQKGDFICIPEKVSNYFGVYYVKEEVAPLIEKSNDKWYKILGTEESQVDGIFPLSWLREYAHKC